jgi:hypothetical protein
MSILPSTLILNKPRATLPSTPEGLNELFYSEPPSSTYTDVPTQETPWNIRLGSVNAPLVTPSVQNYTENLTTLDQWQDNTFNYQNGLVNASVETISHATAGHSGLNDSRSVGSYAVDGKLQKAIFSTRIYRLPMNMAAAGAGQQYNYNAPTGRRKNIQRKAVFAPASSLGYNSRFGSMVFAYMAANPSEGNARFYPVVDSLFYDSSGLCMLQHYRLISGLYLTERGSGILDCTVGIFPSDVNITRHSALKTYQGRVSGTLQSIPFMTEFPGNLFSGGSGW